jgi:hypothetical protein
VPNVGPLVAIVTATNAVAAKIASSATRGEIGAFDGSLWNRHCFDSPLVAAIDPVAGISRRPVDPGDVAGTSLQIGRRVWVSTITLASGAPGRLVGIDPTTLQIVDAITTEHGADISGHGFDSVWQFSYDAGAVFHVPLDALEN